MARAVQGATRTVKPFGPIQGVWKFLEKTCLAMARAVQGATRTVKPFGPIQKVWKFLEKMCLAMARAVQGATRTVNFKMAKRNQSDMTNKVIAELPSF